MTEYQKQELQDLAKRIRLEANGKCCESCDNHWRSWADLIESTIAEVEELRRELYDKDEEISQLADELYTAREGLPN